MTKEILWRVEKTSLGVIENLRLVRFGSSPSWRTLRLNACLFLVLVVVGCVVGVVGVAVAGAIGGGYRGCGLEGVVE